MPVLFLHSAPLTVRKKQEADNARLSMRHIMSRLVGQAYNSLDSSVAAWMTARVMLAAVEDMQRPDEGESES